METYVRDIHSSDGECFDEQVDKYSMKPRRTRAQVQQMRRQEAAYDRGVMALYSQDAQSEQDSSTLSNREGDCNQIIDEQTLEASLNAISQAHLAYSQQALKAVKDVCIEAVRQRDSTIAQLQLENQRLKSSRPVTSSGHNPGGTGESPPIHGFYSSPVSTPGGKQPQVAWNTSPTSLRDVAKANRAAYNPGSSEAPCAPSVNVVESPQGDAPKLARSPAGFVHLSSTGSSVELRRSEISVAKSTAVESNKKAKDDGSSQEERKSKHENGHQVFIDAAAMKEKVKAAIMRPDYNVMNYYKKTGCWQYVARSPWFENITLSIIAFNALWIAIDTDKNKAPTLIVAHPVFLVAENSFCVYFSLELLIRFMAFQSKKNCLRDAWFVFDSCLVIMMVLETWVMSVVLIITNKGGGAGLGDASILRLIRLLRLTRMARMARLLRAFPELMILVKGISVATRSVFFTLCLLAIIIYVFGVAFAQLSEDTPLQELYFDTVPDAMNSLLLRGVFPDLTDFVNRVGSEHMAFGILLLFFVLLSSLTVMNMLVGVLVEVVSVVSSVEKEQMTLQFVKSMILSMLQNSGLDADGNCHINRLEFESLLLKPEAARIIQEVGVDVVGLVDFADFIFKDDVELSFPELMEIVLQLRGSNTATVRDIVDLRKFVLTEIHSAAEKISSTVCENLEKLVVFLQKQNGNKANTKGNQNGGFSFLGLQRQSPAHSNTQPLPEFPQHMWVTELEHDMASQNDAAKQDEARRAGRIIQRRM